jgi:hypothetical protein
MIINKLIGDRKGNGHSPLATPWFTRLVMVRGIRTMALRAYAVVHASFRRLTNHLGLFICYITLYRQAVLQAAGEGHFIRIFQFAAKGYSPGDSRNA